MTGTGISVTLLDEDELVKGAFPTIVNTGLPAAAEARLLVEDDDTGLVEELVVEVVVALRYGAGWEPESETATALTEDRRATTEASVVFIADRSYGSRAVRSVEGE